MAMVTPMITPAWKRLGAGAASSGPALICIYGGGDVGKSRLAGSAMRACPEWFGERALYICVDPESEALGSLLKEDRGNIEKLGLNQNSDLFQQLDGIYKFDWTKEGFKTIITDTMTVFAQAMLAQLTNSGRFSDRHIDLGGGVKQPMQGDFLAAGTLLMSLLRKQQASNMNHITLFHELEVRPEAGQPGEPIGGPAAVGKAAVRSLVNWYNTVLHVTKRRKQRADPLKPIEYERVVHTTGHGIWQAKLRVGTPQNNIPEIIMSPDPANVWTTLNKELNT